MHSYCPAERYEDGEVEAALVYDATPACRWMSIIMNWRSYTDIQAFYRSITAPMACPQPILDNDFELRRALRTRVSGHIIPIYWLRLPQLESPGFSKQPSTAMWVFRMPIWFRKRVLARVAVGVSLKQHSLPAYDADYRVTKMTPIVPRIAMRSFIVLLLIHLFLVIARAVPVSKTLSAKGSYPHPLVVL